jgi:hypothetical protein
MWLSINTMKLISKITYFKRRTIGIKVLNTIKGGIDWHFNNYSDSFKLFNGCECKSVNIEFLTDMF